MQFHDNVKAKFPGLWVYRVVVSESAPFVADDLGSVNRVAYNGIPTRSAMADSVYSRVPDHFGLRLLVRSSGSRDLEWTQCAHDSVYEVDVDCAGAIRIVTRNPGDHKALASLIESGRMSPFLAERTIYADSFFDTLDDCRDFSVIGSGAA